MFESWSRPGRLALGLLAAVLTLTPLAHARMPQPELLGIRLGMEDRDAIRLLKKLGKPASSLDAVKQTWSLRDPRYNSATIRFDIDRKVQWMTAFARHRGDKVRYTDLGDLEDAHRSGTYIYTWTLAGEGNLRPTAITARGVSSEFATAVSIHAPAVAAGPPPIEVARDSIR